MMRDKKKSSRVLFAGGGTGGHVYPAIAIADAIRQLAPEAAIHFAGTRARMEWDAVPRAGYPIEAITVSGLQRSLSARNLTFPFKLARGIKQSWDLVGSFDPDVVVGTGGYVSGPVLFAARLRGRPIVIQEQNAYAGITNRMLGRWAKRIHIAFPEAKRYFPANRCVMSGNPTRQELREVTRDEARAHFGLPDAGVVLLVTGGSLGSGAMNNAMERHLQALLSDQDLHILWQTGELYFEKIEARLPKHERLRLMKFIDRMDLAYAAADLALCRAGAITCSELLVTGTPSILVPSPNVAEDHQTKNAAAMSDGGAAILLPEIHIEEGVVDALRSLIHNSDQRKAMTESAKALSRPEAAIDIARDILSAVDNV